VFALSFVVEIFFLFFFNLVNDELLKMKSRNNTLTILVVIVFGGSVECGPAKTTI